MKEHTIEYTEEAMEAIIGLPQDVRLQLLERILVTSYRWPSHRVAVSVDSSNKINKDFNLQIINELKEQAFFILAHYSGNTYSLHS